MSLKFEIAFNLAVIWMLIFVALGKGNANFDSHGSVHSMQSESGSFRIALLRQSSVRFRNATSIGLLRRVR